MSGSPTIATLADYVAQPLGPDSDNHGHGAGTTGDGSTPSVDELTGLRRHLELGLANLVDGWDDRPSTPLRITKGRVRTATICPAQITTETEPFAVDFNIAVGVVCDAAAGVLAIHPGFPAHRGWYRELSTSLAEEHPHVVAFVDRLEPATRDEFEDRVDELCRALPTLLGDLRPLRPMVHRRTSFRFVNQGVDLDVLLTGEIDLVLGRRHRVLVEVKSGRFQPRVDDELLHYGLIAALAGAEDDAPPVTGCAVTLADLALTPVAFTIDKLEAAAGRVLDTARILIDLDRATTAGRSPVTRPGDHCLWCRQAHRCPAVPDLVVAQLGRADTEPAGGHAP